MNNTQRYFAETGLCALVLLFCWSDCH